MSPPASSTAGSAGIVDGPSGPSGLVTVIVGEVGRTSSSRSRSRSGAGRAAGAEGKGAGQASQWCSRWLGDGPGAVVAGCEGEPDLTITISTEDARQVRDGELEPSVAYMQGRLKSTGDNGLLLRILAWTTTAEFAKDLARWSKELPA
jgi:hypothetical protein